MLQNNNEKVVNLSEEQLKQQREEQLKIQLREEQKILQDSLLHYRQTLSRLQQERPGSLDHMPGITPGELEEREKTIVEEMSKIVYSKRYSDLSHQFRHVILPKGISRWVPQGRLMSEAEWRSLGVVQTPGWTHYMIHEPEPHILLFKRPLDS